MTAFRTGEVIEPILAKAAGTLEPVNPVHTPLTPYGWNADWEQRYLAAAKDAAWVPARVLSLRGDSWRVLTPAGEGPAVLAGRLRHLADSPSDLPAVGDWVLVADATGEDLRVIHQVLPRQSKLSRRASGDRDIEQVMAANVDLAFVVCGLDGDFNLRRLERYAEALAGAGVRPVILLTKADLHPDPNSAVAATKGALPEVAVHALSVLATEGTAILGEYLAAGQTVVLLGSSGAGKSTLLNFLSEAVVQKTQGVRTDDSRGRHTTTHRELFRLPTGALIIDSPGIRELQLWGSSPGGSVFPDIDALAESCRFADCRHEAEPGCAILAALAEGALDSGRHASWEKLRRERAYAARVEDANLSRAEQQRWKAITKSMRGFSKE